MSNFSKLINALRSIPCYYEGAGGKYYKAYYNALGAHPFDRTYNVSVISGEEYLEATKDSIPVKEAARDLIRIFLTENIAK